jgi:4-amino-4-deoxy-L-arabinose transferase-like glycosyltransferase
VGRRGPAHRLIAGAQWLALTGVLLGLGFLTKMMQAFLVLPAFALVYLVAAPTGLGRRVRDLLLAGLALVVSAGWYVALVSLWPASARPFIAGSANNTLWELALGYHGLGRILGGEGNGSGGGRGGQNTAFGGSTGIGRLFGSAMGLKISWLLPAALIAHTATTVGGATVYDLTAD